MFFLFFYHIYILAVSLFPHTQGVFNFGPNW
jgi:hypothetical protein